jgi:uncharacterized protein (DUF1684 family)
MKPNYLLFSAITLVVVLIVIYTFSDAEQSTTHQQQLEEYRKDKDKMFRDSKDSPLNDKQKASFKGLSYFEPDISYRLNASLRYPDTDTLINMLTTTGEERLLKTYAYADFTLNGMGHTLTIYVAADQESVESLFIPFTDETNGVETYETGRYLELEMPPLKDSRLVLDFNTAFNPYCAYSEAYSCPIPPPHNHLKTSIRAGEKSFKID